MAGGGTRRVRPVRPRRPGLGHAARTTRHRPSATVRPASAASSTRPALVMPAGGAAQASRSASQDFSGTAPGSGLEREPARRDHASTPASGSSPCRRAARRTPTGDRVGGGGSRRRHLPHPGDVHGAGEATQRGAVLVAAAGQLRAAFDNAGISPDSDPAVGQLRRRRLELLGQRAGRGRRPPRAAR